MKLLRITRWTSVAVLIAGISVPAIADEQTPEKKGEKKSGASSEAEVMAMMMELAKPGENHKLMAHSVGNWSFKVKMWNDGNTNAAPIESSGSATVKEVMGGRFFTSEHTGKMQMPGADGKMADMEFKGMGMEGYDNVKKKFVSSWADNMGTGIMMSEGDYDAASKTLTYHADLEYVPGMKVKVRQVVKITDNDHHTFEWYEDRGAGEIKTMQIDYTRKK